MKRKIENEFFRAFEFGGTVYKCIDYFRQKYDLGYLPQEGEKLDEKWQNYYDVELPKQILGETEVFNDTVIRHTESPLIDEIENNLNECQTDIQKERYLFSLLKPFSELSRVYHPIAEIERIKKAIQECESEKTHWESLPQNESLNDVAGKPAGTPKEQIEACNSMVEDYKKQIERLHHINKRFREITGQQVNDAGTVEACLSAFRSIAYMFANRLDALLLTCGIDFIKLQKESGIYLKAYRSVTDVDFYLGSLELAQKYINALPKMEDHEQTNPSSLELPTELDTERARKYLKKAIEYSWIKPTSTGYHFNKSKTQLAYFTEKVFCPNKTDEYPETALNKLFGVSRLGSARTQIYNAKKPQKWRPGIDNFFTD